MRPSGVSRYRRARPLQRGQPELLLALRVAPEILQNGLYVHVRSSIEIQALAFRFEPADHLRITPLAKYFGQPVIHNDRVEWINTMSRLYTQPWIAIMAEFEYALVEFDDSTIFLAFDQIQEELSSTEHGCSQLLQCMGRCIPRQPHRVTYTAHHTPDWMHDFEANSCRIAVLVKHFNGQSCLPDITSSEPVRLINEVYDPLYAMLINEGDDARIGCVIIHPSKSELSSEPLCTKSHGSSVTTKINILAGEVLLRKGQHTRGVIVSPEVHRLPPNKHYARRYITEPRQDRLDIDVGETVRWINRGTSLV